MTDIEPEHERDHDGRIDRAMDRRDRRVSDAAASDQADATLEKKVVRAELFTRLLVVALILLLFMSTVSAVVSTFLAVQDHARIEQNKKIQEFIKDQAIQNGQISAIIRDCVQATGKCYQEQRANARNNIVSITDVTFWVGYCIDTLEAPTQQQLKRCVLDGLALTDGEVLESPPQ